jgi:general nucleoside transport system permease protein
VGRALAAYAALANGSLGSPNAISETLLQATPLIFAALAVALGFRSGLFNIGAEGQLYLGAAFAVYVGFAITGLPTVIHLPLALAAGILGGALWGFIPGLLKARTGAHEVITTIMLNYVAYRLIDWLLNQPFFQREGRTDQISKIIEPSAFLPQLIDGLRVHWGLILALAAAVFVSWLLFRSTKGFEFRAVGLNPSAARYAGINISWTVVLTMMISGGLAGLAGASVMLGSTHTLTPGFSPGWGFDAIALALLGGSRPLGVVFAAILFGALRAGATPMQLNTDIPIDLVVIVQALVIMFIAAPVLVQAIYRIRVDRRVSAEVFSKGWGA